LTLSKDLGYIKLKEYKEVYDRYDGLAKALNVFISKLKAKLANHSITQPLDHSVTLHCGVV